MAPPPAPAAPVPGAVQAAPTPGPPLWRRFVFLAVISTVLLALDLGTKVWAKASFAGHRRVEVVTDHLYFTFTPNRGGAWGLLQDQPESVRRPFFVVISIVAIVFIISLYRRLTPQQWALKWGLPLVLGGALGNLANRIQYNYVVDFLDFRADWIRLFLGSDHWPTFNVADVAIVAGVVLMGIDMFTTRKTARAAPPRAPTPPAVTAGGTPAPPGVAGPARRAARAGGALARHAPGALPRLRDWPPGVLRPAPLRLPLRDGRRARSGRGASARIRTSSSTSASPACSWGSWAAGSSTSSPTGTSGTTSTSAPTPRRSTGTSSRPRASEPPPRRLGRGAGASATPRRPTASPGRSSGPAG